MLPPVPGISQTSAFHQSHLQLVMLSLPEISQTSAFHQSKRKQMDEALMVGLSKCAQALNVPHPLMHEHGPLGAPLHRTQASSSREDLIEERLCQEMRQQQQACSACLSISSLLTFKPLVDILYGRSVNKNGTLWYYLPSPSSEISSSL